MKLIKSHFLSLTIVMGIFLIAGCSGEDKSVADKSVADNSIDATTTIKDPVVEAATTSPKATDIDGNTYPTITISWNKSTGSNSQTWMVENLKTTKYNDGTPIQLVTDNVQWINLTSPAYCWYNNDEKIYKNTYGALYNWYVVGTGKLCPKGWHVPSNAEWTTLIYFVGGPGVAGGKLKEQGTTHWKDNLGATNSIGFSALPAGQRTNMTLEVFKGMSQECNFWSSTVPYESMTFFTALMLNSITSGQPASHLQNGFSVRCIKDN